MKGINLMTLILLATLSTSLLAQDIMVLQRRVIFENGDRSKEITLRHSGTKEETYRIKFQQMKMDNLGRLITIEEPETDGKYADSMIRYSPRQVTMQPGQTRTVRLLLRKPSDLPVGEYRSHLVISPIPSQSLGLDVETMDVQSNEVGIKLVPLFGVSLPVIVRNGDLPLSLKLDELALSQEEEKTKLKFVINREGSRSAYGDLLALYQASPDEEAIVISKKKGVAAYTEITKRPVEMELLLPERVDLTKGTLQVVYEESQSAQRHIVELLLKSGS